MNSVFSPDSAVMRAISRAADLVILNFIFLICCVPVVTIGPALTAMYTVVFSIGTSRDKGTVRAFFRAFGANFKKSAAAWCIFIFVAAALAFDMILAYRAVPIMCLPLAVLCLIAVFALLYTFPLMSLFENTVLATLKNAFILSIAHLPRTLAIAVLNLFPFALLLGYPMYFFMVAFIWVIIYFSGAAYISALLLRKVVAPYLPGDTFKEESE